jgi:hypothetical protein
VTDRAIEVAGAPITALIVAIAEAPQIPVPYVTSCPVICSTLSSRDSSQPPTRATVSVPSRTGSVRPPVLATCPSDIVAPSSTMLV